MLRVAASYTCQVRARRCACCWALADQGQSCCLAPRARRPSALPGRCQTSRPGRGSRWARPCRHWDRLVAKGQGRGGGVRESSMGVMHQVAAPRERGGGASTRTWPVEHFAGEGVFGCVCQVVCHQHHHVIWVVAALQCAQAGHGRLGTLTQGGSDSAATAGPPQLLPLLPAITEATPAAVGCRKAHGSPCAAHGRRAGRLPGGGSCPSPATPPPAPPSAPAPAEHHHQPMCRRLLPAAWPHTGTALSVVSAAPQQTPAWPCTHLAVVWVCKIHGSVPPVARRLQLLGGGVRVRHPRPHGGATI